MTKLVYIELRILELTARLLCAEGYIFNIALQLEAEMLRAQIKALTDVACTLKER